MTSGNGPARDEVPCPECNGSGNVWATFVYAEVQAECPYCGGSGRALRRCVERDYPSASARSSVTP